MRDLNNNLPKGVIELENDSLFDQVEEREVQGEIFQVTHRLLQIPREVYLEVLQGTPEPFSEIGAQEFMEAYMKWCGDKNGLLGMVRFDDRDGFVHLDAAIRYRINPQERPSCLTD